jgi:hypothetical protein
MDPSAAITTYILQALGIPKTYIRFVAQFCDGCNAKIRAEMEGKNFELDTGVKQGSRRSYSQVC